MHADRPPARIRPGHNDNHTCIPSAHANVPERLPPPFHGHVALAAKCTASPVHPSNRRFHSRRPTNMTWIGVPMWIMADGRPLVIHINTHTHSADWTSSALTMNRIYMPVPRPSQAVVHPGHPYDAGSSLPTPIGHLASPGPPTDGALPSTTTCGRHCHHHSATGR